MPRTDPQSKNAPRPRFEPKPGYRTTEFWLSAAASLVGLLLASGALAPESGWSRAAGLLASALAAMGYSVSRGAAKGS
jgi:hypothetical protein